MVDTVTVTKLHEGFNHVYYQFTCVSDGTGETDVSKIDISTLTAQSEAPTSLSLITAHGTVQGMSVTIKTDRTADVTLCTIGGFGEFDLNYDTFGGNHDTGTGGTGDILLSSAAASIGDSYNIITKWRKKF